jgi:hypothetical protein
MLATGYGDGWLRHNSNAVRSDEQGKAIAFIGESRLLQVFANKVIEFLFFGSQLTEQNRKKKVGSLGRLAQPQDGFK